jgi:hypothetical protein
MACILKVCCWRSSGLNSLHIAETFRLTVRSPGGRSASRPANQSIMSRTSSPRLAECKSWREAKGSMAGISRI